MDWFTIAVMLLFFGYGVLDAVTKSKLRSDIEELQVAMYGFNFQIVQLQDSKVINATRKTTAKEAK